MTAICRVTRHISVGGQDDLGGSRMSLMISIGEVTRKASDLKPQQKCQITQATGHCKKRWFKVSGSFFTKNTNRVNMINSPEKVLFGRKGIRA